MSGKRDIIDAIDELVDWQLSGGDRSDSFHGEQYRQDHACPWCGNGWHYLPITERMEAMRHGSYGVDEFGQGIVDPDYSYRDDESGIICPGSEFHGPRDKHGTWDKQRRERAAKGSGWSHRGSAPPPPRPSLPPGRLRRIRFHGPFGLWTVSLDDEREIEDVYSNPATVGLPGEPRRVPIITSHRLTCTWELNITLRSVQDREWLERNEQDIEEMILTSRGVDCQMRDITFPFDEFTVHADSPDATEPDWVEFQTTYPIEERHPWFAQFWVWSGTEDNPQLHPVVQPRQGLESPYVIIDEAYTFDNERLRQHVEEAQSRGPRPPSQEAYDEAWRSTVLRGGEEDSSPRN